MDSNQILHSDKELQMANALRGWSKHAQHKSKMADSRHLGKIETSLRNSLTDRDEIWHDDADLRPEVEIRQLHTCALKNDTVGHNGVSNGADTTFHRTHLVIYAYNPTNRTALAVIPSPNRNHS